MAGAAAQPRPGSTTPEEDAERTKGLIDEALLARWMDDRDLPGAGEPLETTFITGGASNELFDVRRGTHRMALRRPPRIVPEGRNETMEAFGAVVLSLAQNAADLAGRSTLR